MKRSRVGIVLDRTLDASTEILKFYGTRKFEKENKKIVEKIYAMIEDALLLTIGDITTEIGPTDTVFIKPNVTSALPPDRLATTDPRVMEALCRFLKDKLPSITLKTGDQPSYGPKEISRDALRISKLELAANRVEIDEIVYFGQTEPIVKDREIEVETPLVAKTLKIYEDVYQADYVIDLPKMKTGVDDIVSLGLKNWQGILKYMAHNPEEGTLGNQSVIMQQAFHRADLPQKIVDIHKVRPANLTIIDGIIAMEGQGPWDGTPVDMKLIIASSDVVAADATACRCMGIEPSEVNTIRIADWHGVGNMSEDNTVVKGMIKTENGVKTLEDPINACKKHFKRCCPNPVGVSENVHVHVGGTCHGCLSNIRGGIDQLAASKMHFEDIDQIHIFCGLDVSLPENEYNGMLIVVGDCSYLTLPETGNSTMKKVERIAKGRKIYEHAGCASVRVFVDLTRDIEEELGRQKKRR